MEGPIIYKECVNKMFIIKTNFLREFIADVFFFEMVAGSDFI